MSIKSIRLAAVVALAVFLTAAPAAASSPGVRATAGAPAVLAWGECPPQPPDAPLPRDPRTQCATLRVPLDYSRPHGRTIDVEVSRIATSVPGQRRGILLSNPGGPG